jgi:hypothetical protein
MGEIPGTGFRAMPGPEPLKAKESEFTHRKLTGFLLAHILPN